MSFPADASNTSHNLPAQKSAFIGRKREIQAVRELLSRHRLLTLTGSGGCGKTRLAIETARSLPDGYKDGVWLIEFAALGNENLLAQKVAGALGLREQKGGSSLETLYKHLKNRHTLLIFDNCEHLIQGCALLAVCADAHGPGDFLTLQTAQTVALGAGLSRQRYEQIRVDMQRFVNSLSG